MANRVLSGKPKPPPDTMTLLELDLWIAEQKVIISHLGTVDEERKAALFRSFDEGRARKAAAEEAKLKTEHLKFKAELLNKYINETNQELVDVFMEVDTVTKELLVEKEKASQLEKDAARLPAEIELKKVQLTHLEHKFAELKEDNAAFEAQLQQDLTVAKEQLARIKAIIDADEGEQRRREVRAKLAKKKKKVEELQKRQQDLEAQVKLLETDAQCRRQMPFKDFCKKFARHLSQVQEFQRKIAALKPAFDEAEAKKKKEHMNMSMVDSQENQDQTQLNISKYVLKTQQTQPKSPQSKEQAVTEPVRIRVESQLPENEETMLENPEDRETLLATSMLSNDIEVASNASECRRRSLEEEDATMDENEGSKRLASQPPPASQHRDGDQQRTSQQHKPKIVVRVVQDDGHEGSFEEDQAKTLQLHSKSQGVSQVGNSQLSMPDSQRQMASNTQATTGTEQQECEVMDASPFDFDPSPAMDFNEQGGGTQQDEDAFMFDGIGDTTAGFHMEAVDSVVNMSGTDGAGEQFLSFMQDHTGRSGQSKNDANGEGGSFLFGSGAGAGDGADFDFDFGGDGTNAANGNDLNGTFDFNFDGQDGDHADGDNGNSSFGLGF
ncbi:unnamed protein product, partial [Mesorhabditis spiculigera]